MPDLSVMDLGDGVERNLKDTTARDQIATLANVSTFSVNFTTGELMYTSGGAFSFEINQTTGDLEWEVII